MMMTMLIVIVTWTKMKSMSEKVNLESDAFKIIVSGDIALIKTGDNHPYYLLKLTKDLYVMEDVVSDDYGNVNPPPHRVVEGHYLEIQD